MSRRAIVLVLDGVGVGPAPDTDAYGDAGSDTLGNLARAVGGLDLPALQALGLGNIAPLAGCPPVDSPRAAWGDAVPRSAGKDSTTGHWELAGLLLERPFPTYPGGFPTAVLTAFAEATGRAVIGNVVGSGTEVMARFGPEHQRTGAWIVYTSADSVFQVAAHEDTVPLAELHAACATARRLLVAPHDVARVIARPFVGTPGAYRRTPHRADFSLPPPGDTVLDALAAAGIACAGVGKVDDLFAGRAIRGRHTRDNADGIACLHDWLARGDGFCFANLVDFDQAFGHRNDVAGFYEALCAFDRALPALLAALRPDDLLILTADHGNDPTTPSTDHSRERVPVLVAGPRVIPASIGCRGTFADVGATVADWFGVGWRGAGASFLSAVVR